MSINYGSTMHGSKTWKLGRSVYRSLQAALYKLLVRKTSLDVKQPDVVQSIYVHTSADRRQSDDQLCSG